MLKSSEFWLNAVQSNSQLKDLLTPRLTEYIPHKPTPKQSAFLLLPVRDAFFGGAAGGGKSDALLMAALQYVDIAGYHAILIRDSFKNLTMPGALIDRSMEWLSPTDAKWNDDKRRWTFPAGATLSFGYLDGPRDHFNYQSSEFQFVGIDEAVNIRENQAIYMFSRLRRLEGQQVPIRFRAASNPPTPEQYERGIWVKHRYVDSELRQQDIVFVPSRLDDNPYLDKDEYLQSLDKLDPITRKQLVEGDWDIQAKSGFLDRSWFNIVQHAPRPEDIKKIVRFWDRAATDDPKAARTAGCKMAVTKNNQYYILSMVKFQKGSLDNERHIRHVADVDGKDVFIRMEQEPGSSGKDTIDNYRRNVLPEFSFKGIRATGSKIDRASPFASQAEAGNVFLVRGPWVNDFLDEAELFPNGKFKDQIDAASGAYNELAVSAVEARVRSL
jgi:predicted phage terminase large subunit-like protein